MAPLELVLEERSISLLLLGMGADLFESFVGSIIAAIQLADSGVAADSRNIDLRIAFPLWIAGFGIISSIVGVFFVRISDQPGNVSLHSCK